ncbi:MAG: ATP-dependent helicase [Patescibacteria group bacterium]|nr:MAG: ATP-dependent helicase [Patescibacteria group bacterium]
MSTFITNEPTKTLNERLSELIKISKELKVLTAFFYFSGLQPVYEALKKNKEIDIKILVGLNIDKTNRGLIEIVSEDLGKSINEKIQEYLTSIKFSLNSQELDKKEIYRQVNFFVDLIKKNKLIIRKTKDINHAKAYIFKIKNNQPFKSVAIMGSSNLTKAGLLGQQELNVELPDIYVEKIEDYFDNLWQDSIQITENDEIKKQLLTIIEEESFIKKITPFQAYVLLLKSYLNSYKQKNISNNLYKILQENGYKDYAYQIDAIKQALSIIENNNGVILADVVGLGKTIMACSIAKELGKLGIIICPPGLKGDSKDTDKGGWNMYKRQFKLYDWDVWSSGELDKLEKEIKRRPEVEVVIIDEAHRFRNEDTQGYEYLKNICRGKKVILLTATPFNNKPSDILSLIKLFSSPKKSYITLDENLANRFSYFQGQFNRINFILKHYKNKPESNKYKKALFYYEKLTGEKISKFNNDFIKKIKSRGRYISSQIRSVVEPITIRRNRLDLLKNPKYKDEIKSISRVKDPEEWFFTLTKKQSEFYDQVIGKYFIDPEDGGLFKGAIYRPFVYEAGLYGKEIEEGQLKEKENRAFLQQKNLYDFMRRLLVKRFESSFGAFKQSIINFQNVTKAALEFISKNQIFILDRKLVSRLTEMDAEEVEEEIEKYKEKLLEKKRPKHDKVYKIKDFKQKDLFLKHIQDDLNLFSQILKQLEELKLVENDPKTEELCKKLNKVLSKEPKINESKRKVVIFSEYLDTVKYLKNQLKNHFKRVLVVEEDLNKKLLSKILENFDASYKEQKDNYDILLTSDKLSEGFNLNRAGMIINYDIPWNPVRVIQRLGRINRINKKLFEELFIVNFFPTEKGANIIKSREIASQKMFLIHNTLGEDSKIFEPDEEPRPAKLYSRLMQNPEKLEEETFYTKVLNIYKSIRQKYPNLVNDLENIPPRVKVAKKGDKNELLVFISKNRQVYVRRVDYENNVEVEDTTLEEVLEKIKCQPNEKSLKWDTDIFWQAYEKALKSKRIYEIAPSELSIERQAITKIDTILRNSLINDIDLFKFIRTLREDIVSYGALPKKTLRTIANLPENKPLKLKKDLYEMAERLGGINYLDKEKKQIKKLKKEVIVAIESKKQ